MFEMVLNKELGDWWESAGSYLYFISKNMVLTKLILAVNIYFTLLIIRYTSVIEEWRIPYTLTYIALFRFFFKV